MRATLLFTLLFCSSLWAQELHIQSKYVLTLKDGNTIEGTLLSRSGQWVKVLVNEKVFQYNLEHVARLEKVNHYQSPRMDFRGTEDLSNELTVATWNTEWLFLHSSRKDLINKVRPNSFDSREPAKSNRPLDLVEEEWKFSSVAALLADPPNDISIPRVIALQEVGSLAAAQDVARRLKEITGHTYIAFTQGKINYAPGHDSALLIRESLQPREISFREDIFKLAEQDVELHSLVYYNGIPNETSFPRICVGEFWFNHQKIRVVSVHLTSGNTQHNLTQSNILRIWLRYLLDENMSLLVIGDFNDFNARPTMSIIKEQKYSSLIDALYIAREVNGSEPLDRTRVGPLSTNQYDAEPIDHFLVSKDLYRDDPDSLEDISIEQVWVVRDGVIINGIDPQNRRRYRQQMLIFKERDLSDHYPLFAKFIVR